MFAILDPEANQQIKEEMQELGEKIVRSAEPTVDTTQAESLFRMNQILNHETASEVLAILRDIEGNNYDSADNYKYINWENIQFPYDVLRRAGDTEPGRLIKNKRRLDFAQWAVPSSQSEVERGVELVFKDSQHQPTKEERNALRHWEQKIIESLFFPANEYHPNFAKFIGNAYEDYFDLDDITLEIRTDGLGRPVAIHLQDPMIFKPIIKPRKYNNHGLYSDLTGIYETPDLLEIDLEQMEAEPDYLLVYQNQKYAAVTRERVRKFHFFVKSDFKTAQKGLSIVEQGYKMIVNIINALTMNASNFTNNRIPPGFFAFTGGGMTQVQLEKMKKIFTAYSTGANNQNRFPGITLPEKGDVKWVGVRANSKDMEYHQFMTLLFTIFCQLSGTDPREVSLGNYGDAVGAKSLFNESTDGIIKESRDIGAKTFLQYFADCLNTPGRDGMNIFEQITNLPIKLRFTGFEVKDRKAIADQKRFELSATKSINDLLAEEDREKEELLLGDVNIYDVVGFQNPQVFQAITYAAQMKAQQEQQQQQMMMQAQQGGMPQQGGQEGNPQQQAAGGKTASDEELLKQYGQPIDDNVKQELSEEEEA